MYMYLSLSEKRDKERIYQLSYYLYILSNYIILSILSNYIILSLLYNGI